MSSRPWNFKKTDIRRAVRSAEEAGLVVRRIDVDPKTGNISLAVGKPAEGVSGETANEWDRP